MDELSVVIETMRLNPSYHAAEVLRRGAAEGAAELAKRGRQDRPSAGRSTSWSALGRSLPYC